MPTFTPPPVYSICLALLYLLSLLFFAFIPLLHLSTFTPLYFSPPLSLLHLSSSTPFLSLLHLLSTCTSLLIYLCSTSCLSFSTFISTPSAYLYTFTFTSVYLYTSTFTSVYLYTSTFTFVYLYISTFTSVQVSWWRVITVSWEMSPGKVSELTPSLRAPRQALTISPVEVANQPIVRSTAKRWCEWYTAFVSLRPD